MQVMPFVWVGAGGAIGACLRYELSMALHGSRFQLATLCVNLLGCVWALRAACGWLSGPASLAAFGRKSKKALFPANSRSSSAECR